MELIKAIKERRSVRKYKEKPVEHEIIEEIIESARYSPSWKNSQIVRYFVIEDKSTLKKLASGEYCGGFEYNAKALSRASAVMIICYIKNRSGFERDGAFSTDKGNFWEAFDCGIAAQTFCLLAHEKGIGTVIQGYFDEKKLAELINLPENMGIGAVIPMGYRDEENDAPPRKDVSALIEYR